MSEFAHRSPFLWFGGMILAYLIASGILFTVRRVIRSINIMVRGWPPPHLDADGDFEE